MFVNRVREKIRSELESPADNRRLGTGWLSGTAALLGSVVGLLFVICLRFPAWLTIPQVREYYNHPLFRLGLHFLLIGSFLLAVVSLILRTTKALGFTAISLVLIATVLGGSRVHVEGQAGTSVFFGLDWFILNVIFTGLLFVPIERLFAHKSEQNLFRDEWREDLFYYFVSSLLVQVITFLSMSPAFLLQKHTEWTGLRAWVGTQPTVLQLLEIMFLTDFVQYWVHRAFHRIPWLWNFHAVHHSAKSMDWMAAARMHFIEVLVLRGLTVIPMFILGFKELPLHLYILIVYVHSALLHANVRWEFNRIGEFLATPRFHHWHHGIEKEAIDVNFSIHFPLLDRLFGTYFLPRGQWPEGYGIAGHPVPRSFISQFFYPFRRKSPGMTVEQPSSPEMM